MNARTRRLAVVATAFLVAALPALAAGPIPARPEALAYGPLEFDVPDRARYRHELANGIVAYVVPDHALPLVNISLNVRTGSWLDPADKPGVAGLTARLLRVGGTASLTPEAFDERADFLAAGVGASAGDTGSSASLNVLTSALDDGLDLLFAMLREPRFDHERLEIEKGKLLEALKQRNDDADSILAREWGWLLYGRDHVGSRKLTAAELDSIGRDDLVDFHRRTWGAQGLVLAISGDVEPETILPELERRLAGWTAEAPGDWPPTAPDFAPAPGLYHAEKEIPQGKVVVGHRTGVLDDWANPDLAPLRVMNDVLGGGGFSSRLVKRVRSDEGLAYGAYSSFGLGPYWPGTMSAGYASKNETVALALSIVLEEIGRIRRELVSDEELRISKASFIETFPRAFESAAQIAGTFASDEILGRPASYWADYRDRVQAVTADDVLRVAQAYLHPDDLVMLVVGKWEEIAPGDPAGRAAMDRFAGGEVTHLPTLDPLTLEPREAATP